MLDEATSAEVGYVGTEHLLLALLQHRDAELADAAAKAGLDADAIRALLGEHQLAEPRLTPAGMPYSPQLLDVLSRAVEYAGRLEQECAGSPLVALALADSDSGVAHDILAEVDPGGRWRTCLPDASRLEAPVAEPGVAASGADAGCDIDTVRLSLTGSQHWIALEYDPVDAASSDVLMQRLQRRAAWSERTGLPWATDVREDSRSGTGRVVISMLQGTDVATALEDLRTALAPITVVGTAPKPRPKPA
ncbi:MAG: hypothetical protein JWM86_401 [Thermoleophilia bacterium]|nr:hypothetical protein [Thermoleophilia bacterium]